MNKPVKPIRFYASKDFRIQEGKWTRKPEDLMYWCDQGDTLWKLVTPRIRAEATGKKKGKKNAEANDQPKLPDRDAPEPGGFPAGGQSRLRRDPGDPAPR